VIQAIRDALATVQRGNALLATQAFKYDVYLLFRRIMPARLATNIPGRFLSRVFLADGFLPNENPSICPRGADVRHLPELTAETLRNGWLHTRDDGYMDDDSFVYVVDRVKDMIISGGENVYSTEV